MPTGLPALGWNLSPAGRNFAESCPNPAITQSCCTSLVGGLVPSFAIATDGNSFGTTRRQPQLPQCRWQDKRAQCRWSLRRRRRAGSDHRIGPAGRHLSQPLLQADRGSTPAPTLGEHLVGRDGQADDGEAAMPVPERPALTNGGQSARRTPVARIPRRRGVPPGNKGGHPVAPPVSHRRRWSSPWLARPTLCS